MENVKIIRFNELVLSGLPTVNTTIISAKNGRKISKTIRTLKRKWPVVWIRTAVPTGESPLLNVKNNQGIEMTLKKISRLPHGSNVLMYPSHKEKETHSGILVLHTNGQVTLELVPSAFYRDLSRGRGTPSVSFTKQPGAFFRKIKNKTASKSIPVSEEAAMKVLHQLENEGVLSNVRDLEKPGEELSLEFDWHPSSGIHFVDLTRIKQRFRRS